MLHRPIKRQWYELDFYMLSDWKRLEAMLDQNHYYEFAQPTFESAKVYKYNGGINDTMREVQYNQLNN